MHYHHSICYHQSATSVLGVQADINSTNNELVYTSDSGMKYQREGVGRKGVGREVGREAGWERGSWVGGVGLSNLSCPSTVIT